MWTLEKIERHGGHFILGNIRVLFGNILLLKGEVLLFEDMFPATFLSIGSNKYLVEAGKNKADRERFFQILNDTPDIYSAHTHQPCSKLAVFLNTVTIILSVYLVSVASRIYALGYRVPAIVSIVLGIIIFAICFFKRR